MALEADNTPTGKTREICKGRKEAEKTISRS